MGVKAPTVSDFKNLLTEVYADLENIKDKIEELHPDAPDEAEELEEEE